MQVGVAGAARRHYLRSSRSQYDAPPPYWDKSDDFITPCFHSYHHLSLRGGTGLYLQQNYDKTLEIHTPQDTYMNCIKFDRETIITYIF